MRAWACLVLLLTLGCDGESPPADAGTDGGVAEMDAGRDAGTVGEDAGEPEDGGSADDGGVVTDAGPSGPCPASLPSGGSCDEPGLVCSYGDDPRLSCRDRATCTDGSWTAEMPDCAPLERSGCPAEMPGAVDTCEGMEGTYCEYGDSACGCTNCFGGPCGGTPMWDCTTAPADERCPRETPNAGAACSDEGLVCDYGTCSIGTQASLTCTDGAWRSEDIDCPL